MLAARAATGRSVDQRFAVLTAPAMPHFRAIVEGVEMGRLDATLREARIGVVIGGDVEEPSTSSGLPGAGPEVASVTVSVDASDREEARRKLVDSLPEDASIQVL